jgi:transketolase
LGQGLSNAVGLAIGQAQLAATYNKDGFELFNNFTYVFCGDGMLWHRNQYVCCSWLLIRETPQAA